MNNQVTFTEDAAAKVKEIIAEEGGEALKLRVFVQGGGCSGFTYGFTLVDRLGVNDDDFEFETSDVSLVVDAMSMQYLQSATIDYKTSWQSSQFVITNPNAISKCGCGSSFGV